MPLVPALSRPAYYKFPSLKTGDHAVLAPANVGMGTSSINFAVLCCTETWRLGEQRMSTKDQHQRGSEFKILIGLVEAAVDADWWNERLATDETNPWADLCIPPQI